MNPCLTTVRHWVRSEDHYYWLTSYLAARGLQRPTCRLVAARMLGIGIFPLILTLSAQGPMGVVDRSAAVAVSVCCIGMALAWTRNSWPSRTQSQACVMAGSVCIAIACLVQHHAALGLLGASAYIVLSAFAALFHDGRLVAFTWVVGIAALIALSIRVGGTDLVVTVCAVLLSVLTNVFVVFVCRSVIRLVDRDFHYGELEPLTGLLTRDAFADRVATLISARDRNDDRFVAIVVVSLDSFSLLTAMSGMAGGRQARVTIGHRLAETLRSNAVLAHVGESEFLIADTFGTPDAAVLTERLAATVRTAPFRLTASIGVVTTPLAPLAGLPPHQIVDELVTLATSNVFTARRAGGQRTHATTCPRLTVVDDAQDGDIDDQAC